MKSLVTLLTEYDLIARMDVNSLAEEIARGIESLSEKNRQIIQKINEMSGIPPYNAAEFYLRINLRKGGMNSLWRFIGCEDALPGIKPNIRMKIISQRIGDLLAKSEGLYGNLFRQWESEYLAKYDSVRAYNAARRRIIKEFVLHLWLYIKMQYGDKVCDANSEMLKRYGWI